MRVELKSAFEPNAQERALYAKFGGVAYWTEMERHMTAPKIPNTAESWEQGLLGRDERYVAVADESHEAALNEALELQAISIRLPRQLIEQYKLIAHFHGVGYQPLMRDVLTRFVPNALREILQAEQSKAQTASTKATLPQRRKKAA